MKTVKHMINSYLSDSVVTAENGLSGLLRKKLDCLIIKEKTIEQDKKQIILDELSKEPLMVIETAYLYAKTFTRYGEDITKAWITAVQQTDILNKVYSHGFADGFKEGRCKNDTI